MWEQGDPGAMSEKSPLCSASVGTCARAEEGVVVAQTFVVQEKEGLVVAIIDMRKNNRPAQAGPVLVAMERRHLGLKKVPRVQIAAFGNFFWPISAV